VQGSVNMAMRSAAGAGASRPRMRSKILLVPHWRLWFANGLRALLPSPHMCYKPEHA